MKSIPKPLSDIISGRLRPEKFPFRYRNLTEEEIGVFNQMQFNIERMRGFDDI